VTALDASPDALALARENAERLGLPIELVHADLRDGLPGGPYDLVVSNPPYVRSGELDGLAPEVREWEPRGALVDEGQTSAVIRAARSVLKPGGWVVLEMAGFDSPRVSRDLAGLERVVEARWPR
jgi:release factor glutamine methyltransferase